MANKKIHLVSLGCDKNLSDSEKILALSLKDGYEFTDDPEAADVIVINTCAFILDAQEESVNAILEMAQRKHGELIVTGCLAERYRDDIRKEVPEVDRVIGNRELQDYLFNHRVKDRVLTTGGHFAYLKIAEGCDKRCTYCIIPFLRGAYRSVPMEDLVAEAQMLADKGVRELILVAQETTVYGKDLDGKKALPELLKKLSELEGLRWIRIMYAYPEEITDELIETIKNDPKICHYLDIPIQHASDRILKAMGRRTTRAEITERIRKIRTAIPDCIIRTTMISGFPGEEETDHKELLSFIKEIGFDRLGDFAYSREEGTAAAKLDGQVPKKTKLRRNGEVMKLQQTIAFEKAADRKGQVLETIVEGRLTEEKGNVYVGRTYMDAPDVDGLIYFEAGSHMYMTGDMIRVRVTGANEYDLIGEVENNEHS